MKRASIEFEHLAHKRAIARKCSRRYRMRRRNGTRLLTIEISNAAATLDAFERIGVLTETERGNDAALERAIAQLCRRGYSALAAEREVKPASPRPTATCIIAPNVASETADAGHLA